MKERRSYGDFILECEGDNIKVVNVLISFYMNHNYNNAASCTYVQLFSNLVQLPSNVAVYSSVQFTETFFKILN